MSSQLNRGSVPFVRGSSKVVGVFGFPVEHSLSPAMHNAAFAALGLPYIYVPFPVPPGAIGPAIRSLPVLGIVGVNLTIPHKESVLPFLDVVTDEARDIGAVNTVHCVEGRLIGDNTDGRGFYEPLRQAGLDMKNKRVVVLGAGGAARAVLFRLAREGALVTLVNRTPERAQRLADSVRQTGIAASTVTVIDFDDVERLRLEIKAARMLVQTTRVGMHPNAGEVPPIPPDALHPDLIVYDLVYNPVATALLQLAKARGCRVMTGVKMLVYQGAAAFERWTGVWPPTDIMEAAVLEGLGQPP